VGSFHCCERSVEETTAITEAITSPVEANDWRDHYIGHDFVGRSGHWDVPDTVGERLAWTPRAKNKRLPPFYDHREGTSSTAVRNASHEVPEVRLPTKRPIGTDN
jgi:hypothetical protein